MKLDHFSHPHPLVLVEEEIDWISIIYYCSACGERVEGSYYNCSECGFCLHKSCAELSREINHPFHTSHPLILSDKTQYVQYGQFVCNSCQKEMGKEFVYHCSSCDFDLDLKCALLPNLITGDFPKLKHFSHLHSLFFIQNHYIEPQDQSCSACEEPILGPVYCCFDCEFFLHQKCFELPREINHPFHPSHPLILYDMSQHFQYGRFVCNSCQKEIGKEFVYHCSSCEFQLDIRCALLPNLITGDFPKLKHFSHQHSLFFIQNHYIEPQDQSCSACEEPISGPIYCCFDCSFFLHQKCFELPLEIKHPSHHKHSLTLLPNPPPHPEIGSYHLCTKVFKGFIYYCSLCEFGIKIKYTFSDKVIKSENHEHPFILVSRPFSFFCDACGTDGEYCIPFVCTECDIAVHKDCISLPRKIKITRHEHPLSHIYFLEEYKGKNKVCRICWDEINIEYGSYRCLQCDYFVHVNCATEKIWWDKDYFEVKDESQESNEALEMLSDDRAPITYVLKEERRGEEVIATEIKHFSHLHNLILSDEIKDDICCDGCIRTISTEFYHCAQCDYSLHKCCAELPSEMRHWGRKKPQTLCYDSIFLCDYCRFYSSGFSYEGSFIQSNIEFIMCIKCFEVPDYFTDQGHNHPLFYDHKYAWKCSSCGTRDGCFRCKYGDFALCHSCVALPRITWYKYDKHPLALTYYDYHAVDQCFCEICEEPRDPDHWFYHCEICEYSVHPSCVLQRSPYVKLGLTSTYDFHPHPLTFVKEDFDYFECNNCGKRCKIVFAKCSESYCKFALHLDCLYDIWLQE
ncbi:hypothetical protein SLE2022_138140 [Rubroshorea leprosula]